MTIKEFCLAIIVSSIIIITVVSTAFPINECPRAKEIASLVKIPACPNCPACELLPAPCPICEKQWCEKPRFQEIVENLASEENYREKYNCDEFSKELIRRLKDAGYRAKYCTGTALWCDPKESKNNCRHAWVRIDSIHVEATTGEFLTPEQFKEDYKLERCG